jgi:hypothetical protein
METNKDYNEGDLNISQEEFSQKIDNRWPDSPFVTNWRKEFDALNFSDEQTTYMGKLCLSPEKFKSSMLSLIKLAEMSALDELKTKMVPIFKQLDSCEYKCEGGVLKMNVAYIELKKLFS